jgi:hypothetical protein
MSTRRQFLGTLGKALGAGGVLLPWAGKGALALPADLGKAAALPVAPAAMPLSPQFLQLREVREALHQCYMRQHHLSFDVSEREWRNLMVNHHKPLEAEIVGRRKPTWQDCREIAEICLFDMHRRRHERNDPRDTLVYAVLRAAGVGDVFVPEIGRFSVTDFSVEEAFRRSPMPASGAAP